MGSGQHKETEVKAAKITQELEISNKCSQTVQNNDSSGRIKNTW